MKRRLRILAAALAIAAASAPLAWAQTALSLDGWKDVRDRPVSAGWEVVDGTLHLKTPGEGYHLLTAQPYGDFELQFQWRIAPGGNSGLKYRVKRYDGQLLGCEYQLIDEENYPHQLSPKSRTGSLYDVYEPSEPRALRPAGEFNDSRILVLGDYIEHWLNGRRIVIAEVGSPQWQRRIAESKFHDIPGFGENRVGQIMLQDHNSEIWFRNIVLRPLQIAGAGVVMNASSPGQRRPSALRFGSRDACWRIGPRPGGGSTRP